MALVINSNIQSLNAQRNLTTSQGDMNTAMERLSSGKRINTAADDAAGLAISSRMTSQIRGIDQAIRNANDGISLIQTAEGALGEADNILQRIRELAVQSANGIYSEGDRGTLDAEAQQLISELQRISENTTFNGLTLLDGSQTNITLQAGADAGNTIDFSIKSVTTDTMGISTDGGVSSVGTSSALAQGDIVINGVTVGASKAGDDSFSSASADQSSISKAAAINAVSDATGVTAVVDENIVAGVSMTAAAATGTVTINGTDFAVSTSTDAAATRAALVETINAKSLETGVTATDSGDDAQGLTLSAADGRNITVALTGVTSAATGIAAAGTYTGGFTLVADGNVAEIEIAGSANLTANSGLTAGTYTAGQSTVNTVSQTAAGSAAAVVDATETSTVGFTDLTAGESITVAGLTYTSTGATTAAQVAAGFASLADGAVTGAAAGTGAYSGALTGYATGAVANTNEVTFTATLTNQDVTDITYSTNASAAGAPVVATAVEGVTGVAEVFTVTLQDFTEVGSNTTITFDGVTTNAITAGAPVTAATVGAQLALDYNNAGTGNFTALDNGDGTVTFTANTTGAVTDVVAGDFTVTDPATGDTGSPIASVAAADVDGVTEATESGTVTFGALADGDSVTVGGLTFTASSAMTNAQVANVFANVAAGATPADPVGGAFTGALSATFSTGAATTNSITFTAAAAGDTVNLVTSGVVAAGGLTVTTTDGSAAVAAGTANFDNLDAGDLVINGTSIGAAKASSDTASYDGVGSSSKQASGIAIAAAINEASDATGVTATVNATEIAASSTTAGTAGSTGTLTLNGIAVSLTVQSSAEDNRTHAVDQINAVAGQTGVSAVDNGTGLTLTAADGRNIVMSLDTNDAANVLAGNAAISAVNFGLDASTVGAGDITTGAVGDTASELAATTYSSVKLDSASTIEISAGSNGSAALTSIGFEVGSFGGASSGQYVKDIDISTVAGAELAINAVDNALNQVADVRSQMGAVSNRLDFTINNLSSISENTSAARSRIVDADYAAESAALSRAQVLQQAGTAMLAQANAQPQQVLSLLQ